MSNGNGVLTSGEFARLLKSKYPEYQQVPDEQLVKAVLDKYPEYRSRVRYELSLPSQLKVSPPPTLKQRIAGKIAEYAPSVVGAIGGLVGTAGGPGGAVAGAALGGGAGEAVGQLARSATGLPSAKTSTEAAEKIGLQGLFQGGAEALGLGAGRVLPKIAPGTVAGVVVPGSAIRKMAIEEGLRMTPPEIASEAGRGSIGRQVQRLTEFGILGRALSERARTQVERDALELADRMIDPLSKVTTPETAGRQVESALDIAADAFRTRGKVYFQEQLPKLGEAVPADLSQVIKEAVRIGKEPSALLRPAEYTEDIAGTFRRAAVDTGATAIKTLPQPTAVKNILDVMSRLKKDATFSEVLEVKQYLDQFLPGPNRIIADQGAESLAKHFESELFKVLDKSSLEAGGPLRAKWIQARNFWRTGRQIYDSAIVRGLMKKNPESLIASIKPGDVTNINIIKKALLGHAGMAASAEERMAGKRAWGAFQRQYVQSALLKDPESQGMSLSTLSAVKRRMDRVGNRQLTAIFNTDAQGRMALQNLRTFAETMSRVQPEMSRNFGKWVELAKIASVGGGAAAGHAETGLEFVAGVEALTGTMAAILYSRSATRALTKAMLLPPTAKAAITANLTRAVALAFQNGSQQPAGTAGTGEKATPANASKTRQKAVNANPGYTPSAEELAQEKARFRKRGWPWTGTEPLSVPAMPQ